MTILLFMPKLDEGKEFHHFPFGLLAIGSALDNAGIDYEIYDERIDVDLSNLDKLILENRIFGVSMFTGYQVTRGFEFLKRVKELNPSAITIVGGPHATALPEQTVQSEYVDYVVAGYGESSFTNLVDSILSSKEYANKLSYRIPGVYSKLGTEILGMPTPKRYREIKWTPLPYNKLDLQKYINPETKRVMYVTQYGCPAPCTFCATRETKNILNAI